MGRSTWYKSKMELAKKSVKEFTCRECGRATANLGHKCIKCIQFEDKIARGAGCQPQSK